jgi:hypothetical protein
MANLLRLEFILELLCLLRELFLFGIVSMMYRRYS